MRSTSLICSLLCLLPLGVLCGCSTSTVRQSPAAVALTPEITHGIEQIHQSAAYVLQPGDLLEIKIFMEEDMDRTLRVNGNGSITYPLVGTVRVAGHTVEQAQTRLAESLRTYLKHPQVSILIKEYGNKTVYVLGQVTKPSAIEIPPEKPLTVLEAITSAGGFTDVAATSKVRVLRMEQGQQRAIDVDITQITKQGNKALDIPLQPADVVFVPQSLF